MRDCIWRILRLLLLTVCLIPAACSMAPVINHQVFDYYKVDDLSANQIILLNILYARDGEPLHFSELSQIRGQLSAQISLSSTFPFGPIAHASTNPRRLATAGVTVSSAPSFDISSLDTKDFTDGVMNPISPQTFAFFLNEGIDYRMVLLLLASGIQAAPPCQATGQADPSTCKHTAPNGPPPEMVLNSPESARDVCNAEQHEMGSNAPLGQFRIIAPDEYCAHPFSEFYAFLDDVNHIHRLFPVEVRPAPKPVGPPFRLDMNADLRSITQMDPTKYTLAHLKDGEYQLMRPSTTPMIALCEEQIPTPSDPSPFPPARVVTVLSNSGGGAKVPANACSDQQDEDDEDVQPPTATNTVTIGTTPGTFILKLRSTFEVIQYVGQILALQQKQTEDNPSLPERCITLNYIDYHSGQPTCDGAVLFRLIDATDNVAPPSDVNIDFGGHRWSLPAPQPCTREPDPDNVNYDPHFEDKCDHTLEAMSIISLLLNQNKSAKDIASTPAVQVVP